MKIDIKILEELKRYNSINSYISEQDAALPPNPGAPAPTGEELPLLPPAPETPPTGEASTTPVPVDVKNDPDVEKLDGDSDKKEELDITDLVKSQKNVEEKQEEYFQNLFSQLTNLESKLSDMDTIVNKLNSLEAKIEKYRIKSPEEKIQLRTLDSGPYNQKLSDFFEDKQEDFEKSGKDQYILTQDEVENYQPSEIKKSFRNFQNNEPTNNI
jgi:hypothetical protein